jgi:hypothetical protein
VNSEIPFFNVVWTDGYSFFTLVQGDGTRVPLNWAEVMADDFYVVESLADRQLMRKNVRYVVPADRLGEIFGVWDD